MQLLAELRRRSVFRVAALYAAISWVLLQIADVVVEPLGLPDATIRLLIILLAVGLPVALLVAWVYELTPEGLKRDDGSLSNQTYSASVGRKLNFAIIALLVVALGWSLATRNGNESETSRANGKEREKTLAVLAFANLSGNEDDGYFADGLSEELMNILARVEGLKVAGRTSSFYFKGRNEDLRDIGQQLGVEHILEGSVRRSGDKLRITAQLIDASDGFHLWSDSFDRKIDDVLVIQNQIAQSVAAALSVELLGTSADSRSSGREADPEAYRNFLVARSRLQKRGYKDTQAAIDLFRRAKEIDPDFAQAHAGFAVATVLLFTNHGEGEFEVIIPSARRAVDRALELDPLSSDVWTARGVVERLLYENVGRIAGDPDLAQTYLSKATELDPENAVAWYWYGSAVWDFDASEALAVFDRVLEIDPLELMAGVQRGRVLAELGRDQDASEQFDRLISVYPDSATVFSSFAAIEADRGRIDRGLELLDRAVSVTEAEAMFRVWKGWLYLTLGLPEEATQSFGLATHPEPIAAIGQVMLAVIRGDREGALATIGPYLVNGPTLYAGSYLMLKLGRHQELLELVGQYTPDILSDDPQIMDDSPHPVAPRPSFLCAIPGIALARRMTGDEAGARKLLQINLETLNKPRNIDILGICRVRTLALLGLRDEAIAAFEREVDRGFRMTWEPMTLHIKDDPTLASIVDDAGFRAQLSRIEDDLALQRAAVLAREGEE